MTAWHGIIRGVGAVLGAAGVVMIGGHTFRAASTETRIGLLLVAAMVGAALGAIIARS